MRPHEMIGVIAIGWLLVTVGDVDGAKRQPQHNERKGQLELRFLNLTTCSGHNKNALRDFSSSIRQVGRLSYVAMNYTLTRGTKTISSLLLEITKCGDGFSFNTCENFQNLRFTAGVCAALVSTAMPWGNFMLNHTPRMKCPLKAGHYAMSDTAVDMAPLRNWPSPYENNKWSVDLTMSDDKGEELLCLMARVEYIRYRSK